MNDDDRTTTDLLALRRDDLRAELRARGLSVAGTKEELVERLTGADAGAEPRRDAEVGEPQQLEPVAGPRSWDAGDDDHAEDVGIVERLLAVFESVVERGGDLADVASGAAEPVGDASVDRLRGEPLRVVRRATRQLEQLSGHRVEAVSGFEPLDDGWRIGLELVEVASVPPSDDVLGSYDMVVDVHGDVIRYERTGSHPRAARGTASGGSFRISLDVELLRPGLRLVIERFDGTRGAP